MNKMNVKALGLALGVVWGLWMFLLGISVMSCNWGAGCLEMMASFYIGYKATLLGSIIGAAWGFVDGGLAGALIAWLYNKFSRA